MICYAMLCYSMVYYTVRARNKQETHRKTCDATREPKTMRTYEPRSLCTQSLLHGSDASWLLRVYCCCVQRTRFSPVAFTGFFSVVICIIIDMINISVVYVYWLRGSSLLILIRVLVSVYHDINMLTGLFSVNMCIIIDL